MSKNTAGDRGKLAHTKGKMQGMQTKRYRKTPGPGVYGVHKNVYILTVFIKGARNDTVYAHWSGGMST